MITSDSIRKTQGCFYWQKKFAKIFHLCGFSPKQREKSETSTSKLVILQFWYLQALTYSSLNWMDES